MFLAYFNFYGFLIVTRIATHQERRKGGYINNKGESTNDFVALLVALL